MRILTIGNMYPPQHLGGYELMWRSSSRQLRQAGHEVRILTTDFSIPTPDPSIREEADVHRELGWYWRDHRWPRLGPLDRARLERRNLAILDRHLEDFRPDAIAWWAMGGMSLSLIVRALERGVPGAAIVVDDWLIYGPKEDQWQRLSARLGPVGRAIGRAAGIPTGLSFDSRLEWLLVSESVASGARASGWTLTDAAIIHAGVDLELFDEQPERPWRWHLSCVGRLDPRKGTRTAIEAVAALPDATLEIVGSGDADYERRLRERVAELDLADRVRFSRIGRDQLPTVYAGSDAILFPVSWSEPFGIVPLEAMAVGRPVVASGTGGSGEYLRDGENCVLFSPPDDPGALAAAVTRLAGDPRLRAQVRAGGSATAASRGELQFNLEVERLLQRAAQ